MPRPVVQPSAYRDLGAHGYALGIGPQGTGAARYRDCTLTGDHGLEVWLRDLADGTFWTLGGSWASPSSNPAAVSTTDERHGLRAELTISPATDVPAEIRRLVLTNLGHQPRRIDVTTFVEVVLHDPLAHAAHPVFSKLFLQTEFVDGAAALVARRRAREPRDQHPWLVHASLDGGPVQYETDRARFLGRGRPPAHPAAMATSEPLSGTCGNVLDPCLSLRRTLTISAGQTVELGFLLGAAEDQAGALALARRGRGEAAPVRIVDLPLPPATLDAPNGHGRFADDGREYVIRIDRRSDGSLTVPPRPWVNVIANESFGCLVSETGAGTAWSGNSREHRLTPWFNDPVLDPHGDAVYLQDQAQGTAWSCWPGPAPAPCPYEVRHGFGYTRCRFTHDDLAVDTLLCVAQTDPVRITRVTIANLGTGARRLTLWAHARLVLGTTVTDSAATTTASFDPASGALHARNPGAGPWSDHVAFGAVAATAPDTVVGHGTSHQAFAGSGGLASPAFATDAGAPSGSAPAAIATKATTGTDAAFTHRLSFTVEPGERCEVVVLLGDGSDLEQARQLTARYTQPQTWTAAWHEVRDFWRQALSRVQVSTPSPALDLMVNGWLGYQTLSCRLWGRTAFYQSGGAFGFRDQLQDALALLPLWPQQARRQILLNAAHQFREGDVLHWWHPPLSQGIRTRFADDLLWLPYLAAHYVATTGDHAVLDEVVPYLSARELAADEDEALVTPEPAGETGDLYDHCCRALDRSLSVGAHGLPLFGTGDWNDGMNRVGRDGRGESVWMGFFLVTVIDAFSPLCTARADHARADRYRRHREALAAALNDTGWDGAWYRRGYYDDGTPLGSAGDPECRIDALVQAWSILSQVAPPARRQQVLDAVEAHLIDDGDQLVRLLTPPFVDTPHDPGYIKGYVAGVRENGGQYTHAALWVVRAMAEAGRRNRAAALLAMLSPCSHTATPAQVARYQVEPYVVAADVYGATPHIGRGGWTWYTGASGWMLRVALESILGLRTEQGTTLVLAPCIPDDWPGFSVRWCAPQDETVYEITVTNPGRCSAAVVAATVDGASVDVAGGVCRIPLRGGGGTCRIEAVLGAATAGRP